MQLSPSQNPTRPSTKAALDHLQHLIEQLLDENHNLKHSLRETRSQLDQVRAHLNRFKLDLAEHEKNDRLVRTHVRTMANLIERSRQPNLPISRIASTTLPPSLRPPPETRPCPRVPSHTLPSRSLSSSSAPSSKAPSPAPETPTAPSLSVPSPGSPPPKPPSPSPPSRSWQSPKAPSLRAPSPSGRSLRPETLRPVSPSPPSPSPQSPKAPSLRAPSLRAPSLRAPSLSGVSLRPTSPSPSSSSPSSPSPQSPKAPSLRAPSPSPPSPSPLSPSPPSPSPLSPSPLSPSPLSPSPLSPSPPSRSPPSRSPPSRSPPSRSSPSASPPSASSPSPSAPSASPPSASPPSASPPSASPPSASPPSASPPSPSPPSPSPPSPSPQSPKAPSLRAPPLSVVSLRPLSPSAPPPSSPSQSSPSPRASSPGPQVPKPPSPGPQSPKPPSLRPSSGASSLKPPSPSAPSPGAPSPSTPPPNAALPRLTSPGPLSPSAPLLRAPSSSTTSPNTLSPGTTSRSTHRRVQKSTVPVTDNLGRSLVPTAGITKTQDIYASPKINGNGPQTMSTADIDSPSYTESTPERIKHTELTQSRCVSQIPIDVSSSPSSGKKSSADKRSAPTTSVSDALQKAFVAMEKDTTNAVHVLHDPSHIVSLRTAEAGEHGVESVSLPPSPTRDTKSRLKLPANPGANGIHGEELHSVRKQSKRHTRKRPLKASMKNAEPTSPASDTALPQTTKQSSFTGANGRLKRSMTQTGNEATRSQQRSANKLGKTVSLKRTKKGYKVSLGLSRDSQKSGKGSSDSSSSSSDSGSDSDSSSGPGCSVSLSRPHNRPTKAQVSMEGGLSDLMNAARKLKHTLAQRKDDDENSEGSSSGGPDSEGSKSGNESNHAGEENNDTLAVGNGSVLSAAAAVAGAGTLCAIGSSDLTPEPFPYASGVPKLDGIVGERNNHIQGGPGLMQNHATGWSTWQLSEGSFPGTYGTMASFPNRSFTAGFPRNPVAEPEKRHSPDDAAKAGNIGLHQNGSDSHSEGPIAMTPVQGDDLIERSPAAGKATESEAAAESEEDAEYPIIHEITHVSAMPRAASDEEKLDSTSTSRASTSEYTQRTSTEFLTIHSCGSQLLRWKACPGSRYVDVSRGALAVKHPAAIAFENGKIVINGKMRILEPLRVEPSEANHYFASPIYPDGSFLPYVPVSGVCLHARPVHWDNSRYAHRSVQLSFPKEIFDAFVLHIRRAYRKRDASTYLRVPGAFLAGNRVRKAVKVEPDCSVNMTKLQRSPTKCSVAEAIACTKKDVIGLALLYVSIEEPSQDRSFAEVRFGLHSMVAHHLSADRKR